ncbi:MAG: ECF-type sigma factor [Thermoanaerobaculia bacterium]
MSPTPEDSRPDPGEVTRLLRAWRAGGEAARERLIEHVYAELKKIAGSHLRRERRHSTLEATGLVHEAFLRLVPQARVDWRDRAHFFGLASTCMRRVLVDRARARAAAKRDPEGYRLTAEAGGPTSAEELLDLDRALARLEEESPRLARVVEMRYFTGLEVSEIAECLAISERTVKRDWAYARAWLLRELGKRS